MSRADVPRAFVAIVALVATASFVACSSEGLDEAQVDAVVPSVDSISVRFSCGTVDSIALKAPNGGPAWAVRRSRNEPISWVVPTNVTINSIAGLPLDSAGSQGGTPGTPYKSKVKNNAESKTYHYAIDATCRPASGDSIRLIIDPEFIVHP
jgi:hypothetical protein